MKEGDKFVTGEQLARICGDPKKINIISNAMRPGAAIFATRLEFEHFRPDTQRNILFDLIETEFGEMLWLTMSIPAEDQEAAERIAQEEKMRLAPGYPRAITAKGVADFPIRTPNTFVLENAEDHPCNGDKQALLRYKREEDDRIQQIWNAHTEWWEKLKNGSADE